MKFRTKMRLKFYLTLLGLVLFTLLIGVFFSYVVFLGWKLQLGTATIPFHYFVIMAAILFIMSVSDVYFFFHLVLKRQYW